MKKEIIDTLRQYLKGNIAKHKTNVDIYLNQTVGIGEHSDIIETIEKELDGMASYDDKLEMLNKYFDSDTTEILKD